MGRLETLDSQGNFTWRCPNPACAPLAAHISHTDCVHTDDETVALPPCACGSRAFLKVRFTPAELEASNMKLVPTACAKCGTPIMQSGARFCISCGVALSTERMPTESHAAALRHMELSRQMSVIGKTPPAPGVQVAAPPSGAGGTQ